jgi:hypothetical protein
MLGQRRCFLISVVAILVGEPSLAAAIPAAAKRSLCHQGKTGKGLSKKYTSCEEGALPMHTHAPTSSPATTAAPTSQPSPWVFIRNCQEIESGTGPTTGSGDSNLSHHQISDGVNLLVVMPLTELPNTKAILADYGRALQHNVAPVLAGCPQSPSIFVPLQHEDDASLSIVNLVIESPIVHPEGK